LTETAEERSEI